MKPPEKTSRIPAHAIASIPSLTEVESFDLLHVSEKLLDIELQSADRRQAITRLCELLQQLTNACAVVYFQRDLEQNLSPLAQSISHIAQDAVQNTLAMLQMCGETACRNRDVHFKTLDSAQHLKSVTVPLFCGDEQPEDALSCIFVLDDEPIEPMLVIVQFIASAIELWDHTPRFSSRQQQLTMLEEAAWINETLLSCKDHDQSLRQLVNGLAARWECDKVFIGLAYQDSRSCLLAAISECEDFDTSSPLVGHIEALFDETLAIDQMRIWPSPSRLAMEKETTPLKQTLASTGSGSAILLPLKSSEGQSLGVLGLVAERNYVFEPFHCERAKRSTVPLQLALENWRRSRGSFLARTIDNVGERLSGNKTLLLTCFITLMAGIMMIPMPSRIPCDSTVQPISRRYVASQLDAKLDQVLVQVGDSVTQGQLLARLDDRELRWKLAGIDAQRARAKRIRDASMALDNIAETQMAELELESYELEYQLLKYQQNHLEVVAPISGVIIAGDLEKDEGVPVHTGQVLFEIAPQGKLMAEIEIPDEEVCNVRPGMSVSIRMNSHPNPPLQGIVDKISPSSKQRDGANYFVGQVLLEEPPQYLRVGMDGRARIIGDRRALGWTLFHKAYDYFMFQFGW